MDGFRISALFNSFMSKLFDMPITSGVLLVAPLWYLWFETKSKAAQANLLLGVGAAVAALIVSRGLQIA